MKVYLAGTSVCSPDENKIMQGLFQQGSKLHSFFHCREGGFEYGWFNMNKKNKVDLFLDSGAFSAWTQGIEVDIQEYIKFIKEHEDILEVYANLDVIGLGGKLPNKLTAEMTLKNQKIMEEAGLNPLPCFHFGEPFEYLKYYVDNYDYMAFGVAGVKGSSLVPWLDTCFSDYVCDEKGYPKIKVHGFAVTSLPLMWRYPWYSVDSTSWVMTSRTGAIYVPRYKDGEWIYDENSWKIAVSNRNPKAKRGGAHISTLPPKKKQIVLEYIHAKGYALGHSEFKEVSQSHELKENERWAEKKPKDKSATRLLEVIVEEGISNRYQLRDEMNIIYFRDLEKAIPPYPRRFKMKGFRGFDL